MSHKPSPSTSPSATPEPFSVMRFFAAVASERMFENVMPEVSGGRSVKPVLPWVGIVTGANRWLPSDCHCKGAAIALENDIGTTAIAIRTKQSKVTVWQQSSEFSARGEGSFNVCAKMRVDSSRALL